MIYHVSTFSYMSFTITLSYFSELENAKNWYNSCISIYCFRTLELDMMSVKSDSSCLKAENNGNQ